MPNAASLSSCDCFPSTPPNEKSCCRPLHTLSQSIRFLGEVEGHLCDFLLHWKTHWSIVRVVFTAILIFALASCGGGGGTATAPTAACTATSFDNQTNGKATEAQLLELWQHAQQDLATEPIVLNPVAVQVQGGTLQTVAPDLRAEGIMPHCVAVITMPDLTVAELQAENPGLALQHNADPTGVIHCPTGALAKYCVSFTATNNQAAYVAESQVLNFGATGWEFENIILARLGYNTSGR